MKQVKPMIQVFRSTQQEWETTQAASDSEYKMAVINYCRREGHVLNEWFYYAVPGMWFKTQFVDRFVKPGKI